MNQNLDIFFSTILKRRNVKTFKRKLSELFFPEPWKRVKEPSLEGDVCVMHSTITISSVHIVIQRMRQLEVLLKMGRGCSFSCREAWLIRNQKKISGNHKQIELKINHDFLSLFAENGTIEKQLSLLFKFCNLFIDCKAGPSGYK